MRSIRYILAILLATTSISYSQNSVVVTNTSDQTEYPGEFLAARYTGANFREMRNQFREEWQRGDIMLSSGKVIANQLIRYNYFLHELVWSREPDFKIGIIFKESIKEFYLYPENGAAKKIYRKLLLEKSFIEGGDREIFVQILVEGIDTVICYRKLNKAGNTDEYSLSNHYYLMRNGELLRFYLQRSSVLSLFEDEERQKMKSIIRSNHLRVRKEDAMIRAFELFIK